MSTRHRLIPLVAIVTSWGAPLATGQEAGAIRVDTAYFHVDVGGRYPWSEYALGLVDFDKTDQRSGLLKVHEWYDEGNHHGAKGYPGVMEAVGQTFRRFQLVAPLILQAHPTTLATCDREKVWLKTLVCGPDLLLVAVNDDYESLPADVQVRAQQQVEIRLPNIPWLKPTQALQVDDGSFTKLELASVPDGTRLALPTLKVGQVIVVTGDERLSARLLARYRTLRTGRR